MLQAQRALSVGTAGCAVLCPVLWDSRAVAGQSGAVWLCVLVVPVLVPLRSCERSVWAHRQELLL